MRLAGYYLLIRLGSRGDFTLSVWERDNPSNVANYRRMRDASWTGRDWWTLFQLYEGTVDLEEYAEMSFPKQ
jgi:hypothetical protein